MSRDRENMKKSSYSCLWENFFPGQKGVIDMKCDFSIFLDTLDS